MSLRRLVVMLSCAASLALPHVAWAVNKAWNGTSGNWTTGSNWSPSGVPNNGDAVFVTEVATTSYTVTYQDSSLILREFPSVLIDSSGVGRMTLFQTGSFTTLAAGSLQIGLGGPATYNLSAGDGTFGNAGISSGGTLNVGSGAVFNVSGNFNQASGTTVTSDGTISVGGTYTYGGGTGTGNFSVGTLNIGNVGTFAGFVEVAHKLVFSGGSGNFTGSVTNHGSFTLPASQSIFAINTYAQLANFTQDGRFSGPAVGGIGSNFLDLLVSDGATWTQNASFLQANTFTVGAGAGGAGSYTILGAASTNFGNFSIGVGSDGTVIQSGGTVRTVGLAVGGSAGLLRGGGTLGPAQRGFYTLTAGTLNAGQLLAGAQDAISGAFLQTGGVASFDSFTVNVNSTSNARIDLSGGTFLVADNSVNNGTFNQTGGIATINANVDGAGTMSMSGNGSMTVGRIRQATLNISGNALVRLDKTELLPNGVIDPQTDRVRSLQIQGANTGVLHGRLDLGVDKFIVDYDAGASPIADIRRALISGFANGAWTGQGIGSVYAQNHTAFGVGYDEASDALGSGGGVYGGVLVDSSAVLFAMTYDGDTNLDGKVDILDLGRLASHWQSSGQSWSSGDMNYDGAVNIIDLGMLASNWQAGVGSPLSEPDFSTLLAALGLPDVSLPEPLAMPLCMFVFGVFATRRKRFRRA